MTSIFSFLRDPAEPENESEVVAALPAPTPVVALPPPSAVTTATTLTTGQPSPADVLTDMVNILKTFLVPSQGSLPPATVSITSVTEKPVGLGNFRGEERRGGITAVALKGGRLSGLARFQLWADAPDEAGILADGLHGRLLAAKDSLWNDGFLKFIGQTASLPEHTPSLDAWYKTLDYQFLYEYHYEDSDGAESLIATIPIHTDPEEPDSPLRETSVVSDALVRWDQDGALPLTLAGRLNLSQLSMLIFVPGTMPGDPVAIVRTFAGATVSPTDYPSFTDFMTAVTHPQNPERNGRFTFATFTDFLNAFATTGDLIALGDWDESGIPDTYEGRQLAWTPPIRLATSVDRLQIIYAPGSSEPKFDQTAVLYLQAGA